MNVKIHLATTQIYGFYWRNYRKIDSDTEVLIAENKDNGMSLYLTSEGYYPQLIVYNEENRPIIWRLVRTTEECNLAAVFLISHYLVSDNADQTEDVQPETQESVDEESDTEESDDEEDQENIIMDTIYQREDELEMAMSDFLATAFCEDDREVIKEAYGKDIVKDTLDDFLQYLYDKHLISVYRPTMIHDDDTGEEVLAEFPYGWFDEDDTAK